MSIIKYKYNYNILNDIFNEKDLNQEYNKKMKELFDEYKGKVVTNFLNGAADKNIQKNRIIKNYIVPLCYLIYSYIYTKYYNLQVKKTINNESDTIYDMLGFLFSPMNPSTKMLNVYYYKEFNKVKETNTNKNNSENINLYSKMKDEKEKNILFLQQIISLFKKDSDLTQIYKVIIINFKKLIKEIIKIVNNVILKINIDCNNDNECNKILEIKRSFDKEYGVNDEFNNYEPISTTTNIKIPSLLQELSTTDLVSPNYKKLLYQLNQIKNDTNFKILLDTMLKLDISKYAQIKSQYSELSTLYNKNFLSIINEINKNIILLKNSDEILTEDELSFKFIADRFLNYYKKYNENIKEKKNNDIIIEHITNIINITQDEIIDLNKIFYNKKINNSNLNDIVDKPYDEKNKQVIALLNSLSTQTYNNYIATINTKIQYLKKIDNINNIDIKYLLQLYFLSIAIYNNIENKYIKVFLNKSYEINSIKSSYIENIKKIFEIKFRQYERSNKDKKSEYIEYLNENEKIYEKENDELIQYESEEFKNNSLNNSKSLSEYQKEKNDAQRDYDTYNNKYFQKITDFNSFYINLNNSPKLNEIIRVITSISIGTSQNKIFSNINGDSIESIIESFNNIVNQHNYAQRINIISIVNNKIKPQYFSDINFTTIQQIYIADKELSNSDFLLEQAFKINNFNQIKLNTIKQKKTEMEDAASKFEKKQREIDIKTKRTFLIKFKKIYYSELKTSIANQRTKLESENSSKKIIPLDSYGISFDSLINITLDFEKTINIIKFKNTDNKLFFIFETDLEKLNKINDNLNNLNNLNIQKKITNLQEDINNYFIATNSTSLFNKLLSKPTNSNKTVQITPILEEYSNYNKNLTNKIKVLLNNINKQNIKLNDISNINHKINIFKNNIIKNKIDKYKKIYNELMKEHNKINGSIKYIVSYTNVIYIYFINLLIIIDFLTYFYS